MKILINAYWVTQPKEPIQREQGNVSAIEKILNIYNFGKRDSKFMNKGRAEFVDEKETLVNVLSSYGIGNFHRIVIQNSDMPNLPGWNSKEYKLLRDLFLCLATQKNTGVNCKTSTGTLLFVKTSDDTYIKYVQKALPPQTS